MTIRHFLSTQDWSRAELDALLQRAAAFKRYSRGRDLEGKSIALLFFTGRFYRKAGRGAQDVTLNCKVKHPAYYS